MKITDIKIQKNKMRSNIFIDGSFFCGLENLTILKNNIKIGQEISQEKLEKIQLESEIDTALEKALLLLDKTPYTQYQLSEKLKFRGYLTSVIFQVVEKLKNMGLIDDKRYCENFIKYNTKISKKELEFKLMKKGIKKEIIKEVLEENTNDQLEKDACKNLCEKKIRGKVLDKDAQLKLTRYLVGKGFNYSLVKCVLKDCLQNFSDDDDGDFI